VLLKLTDMESRVELTAFRREYLVGSVAKFINDLVRAIILGMQFEIPIYAQGKCVMLNFTYIISPH
jgi:hypothetical protein